MNLFSVALLGSLTFAAPPSAPAGREPSSFKETADFVTGYMAIRFVEERIAIGPEASRFFKDGRCSQNFHIELIQALRSDDAEARKAGLKYLETYATLIRASRWEFEHDEGTDAFRHELGKHARAIERGLKRLCKRASADEALLAAIALLALCENDPDGLRVVVAELTVEDLARREVAAERVRDARLSHPRIVAVLATALGDREKKVRLAAAEALGKIGPRARSAVPSLITFLQRGEDAWGELQPFCAIALPESHNLALLALAEIGAEARPAVPIIARMLQGAAEKDRVALLSCLGQLGSVSREAVAEVRKYLRDESPTVRLYAAVALLCIEPDEKKACDMVMEAIKSSNNGLHGDALKACSLMGPKVKALVPPLVAALTSGYDNRLATLALAKMGPVAASAVPMLSRLLTRESNDHTIPFLAAHILARMGKAGLPALLQVVRARARGPGGNVNERKVPLSDPEFPPPETTGRAVALSVLGQFRDSKAEVVPVLLETLNDRWLASSAALALGRLRPDDPSVKDALLRARDRKITFSGDTELRPAYEELAQETRVMAAWALTQLPRR